MRGLSQRESSEGVGRLGGVSLRRGERGRDGGAPNTQARLGKGERAASAVRGWWAGRSVLGGREGDVTVNCVVARVGVDVTGAGEVGEVG